MLFSCWLGICEEERKERSAMDCTYSAFAMMLGDGESRGGGEGACHKVFTHFWQF